MNIADAMPQHKSVCSNEAQNVKFQMTRRSDAERWACRFLFDFDVVDIEVTTRLKQARAN